MAEAKLSSKNQIVVPRQAREALGVRAGDKLLVVTRGDSVILFRKPARYARVMRGIGAGLYPANYIKEQRGSW